VRTNIWRTAPTTSLLIGSLLTLLSSSVRSESILFSDFTDRNSYFTHTVFHGSENRYDRISNLTFHGDPSDGKPLLSANFDHTPAVWKYKIAVTVFWIGEQATETNPRSNMESAWDVSWVDHYGGEDDPTNRINFIPSGFTPGLNPFYVALPYNDVDDRHTRPEAPLVIPWFKDCFIRDGQSVCKGHWVAIRHGRNICYAQWEDVGPFQADHWQYVFGSERPRPNANRDSGLDVSPAVRDYLGLSDLDVCDWKFVNVYDVPNGPWTLYGDNNTAAQFRSRLKNAPGERARKEFHHRDTEDTKLRGRKDRLNPLNLRELYQPSHSHRLWCLAWAVPDLPDSRERIDSAD
jgi:hypothetical protein